MPPYYPSLPLFPQSSLPSFPLSTVLPSSSSSRCAMSPSPSPSPSVTHPTPPFPLPAHPVRLLTHHCCERDGLIDIFLVVTGSYRAIQLVAGLLVFVYVGIMVSLLRYWILSLSDDFRFMSAVVHRECNSTHGRGRVSHLVRSSSALFLSFPSTTLKRGRP